LYDVPEDAVRYGAYRGWFWIGTGLCVRPGVAVVFRLDPQPNRTRLCFLNDFGGCFVSEWPYNKN